MEASYIPVYSGQFRIGEMHENDCREMIRNKEAKFDRRNGVRKLQLKIEATSKARALCNTSRSVMATTQREELYSGFRKEFTDTPMTVNPITVLRRPGDVIGRDMLGREVFSFVDWTERDRFPRHGFNPDLLPRPNFTRPASHCNFVSAA